MNAAHHPVPPASSGAPAVVLLRADAAPAVGVGHTMRLLALSQELLRRGTRVHLAGDIDIAWVWRAYAEAGITVHPRPENPSDLVALARALGAAVCVLDRYDLGPAWGRALRDAGVGVMAMVDDGYGADQDADLYVDQNPGAPAPPVAADRQVLAGADFALFRDDILALRRAHAGRSHAAAPGARSKVLAVFGGTDPMGAAPVIAPLILATGAPLDLTVVSPDDSWATQVRACVTAQQSLEVIEPVTDLAARAVASDLVVTAGGTSVWELLCVGAPIGVVRVIDNQAMGYTMVVDNDLAAGVGHLPALRDDTAARDAAVMALRTTLADPDLRRARVARGQALLDGRGRVRVADAIARLAQA